MPGREDPIRTGKIYHIFNKTIDDKNIFTDQNNCEHFINLIKYYRSIKARVSHSKLNNLSSEIKDQILSKTRLSRYFQVEIFTYTLMPTHFHLLLRQQKEKGIQRFIADITNALTRHYNLKNERKGSIFQSTFKSVSIKSEEQFNHVSRYIHLNPYSSGLVKNYQELMNYPWTSYKEYIFDTKNGICNQELIFNHFKTKEKYRKFIEDHADYQRNLEYVKHSEGWDANFNLKG